MSATPDHYKVLGIPRDASVKDIERARKSLARQWHPDINKSAEAARHFDEVQKAAEVLRDPIRRAAYDRETAIPAIGSLHDHSHTAPANSGRAHFAAQPAQQPPRAEPGVARTGTWAGSKPAVSRRVLRWAGLAGAAVIGCVAVLLAVRPGPGTPSRAAGGTPEPRAVPSAAPGGGPGQVAGTFALPAYTAGQAMLPVGSGRVLAIGRTITLLAAGGQVLWHETAGISPLDASTISSGGPQASSACAVASDGRGRHYDFISLASGRQAVIAENPSPVTGSFVLAGSRVALPDGTIRDACTGAVLSRAAPNGTLTTPECLARAVVIGAGRPGLTAWRNGHQLWRLRISARVACDPRRTAVLLDTGTQIRFLDPVTGRAFWAVRAPACPGRCAGRTALSVRLFGTAGAIVLSRANQVLTLASDTGRLIWRQSPACALAVRAAPSPRVLLGPCPGGPAAAGAGTATAVNGVSGAVISRYPLGGNGCAAGSEWAANSRQLLVVCRGAPETGPAQRASLINW